MDKNLNYIKKNPKIIIGMSIFTTLLLIVAIFALNKKESKSSDEARKSVLEAIDNLTPTLSPRSTVQPPVIVTTKPVETDLASQIEVINSGFTYIEDQKTTYYGFLFKNNSDTIADDVLYDIEFLDAAGAVVAKKSGIFNIIPAKSSIYVTGVDFTVPGNFTKLQVKVTSVTPRGKNTIKTPEIKDLNYTSTSFDGKVTGNFTHTYASPIKYATVHVVALNEAGQIVAGNKISLNNIENGKNFSVRFPQNMVFKELQSTVEFPTLDDIKE